MVVQEVKNLFPWTDTAVMREEIKSAADAMHGPNWEGSGNKTWSHLLALSLVGMEKEFPGSRIQLTAKVGTSLARLCVSELRES